MAEVAWHRFPLVARSQHPRAWLQMCADLGLAAGTLEAYGRGLGEYLGFCQTLGVEPEGANRPHVAAFVRHLRERPAAGGNGTGLANATLQQRLTAVRRFYEYLREEGLREANPVGRGRYAVTLRGMRSGAGVGWLLAPGHCRGCPRMSSGRGSSTPRGRSRCATA